MTKKTLPSFFLNDEFPAKSGIFVSKNDLMQFHIHQHDYFEFEYITSGHGVQLINGEDVEVSSGDVLFVTPSDFHGYMSDRVFHTITVHFLEDSIGRKFRDIVSDADACIIRNAPPALADELSRIYEIYNTNNSWTELRLKNSLERILIDFFSIGKQTIPKKRSEDKIGEAILYINKNYRSGIGSKMISELFYISSEYFSKMFKARTGKGVVEYINDKRIEYAKKLLRGGVSVTDASYASGFGSERNFCRQFTNRVGMSPRDFKKIQKLS